MQLCSCGFANPDDATVCRACGTALGEFSRNPSTPALRASAQDDTETGTPHVILSERSESKDLKSGTPRLSLINLRTDEVIPIPSPGVIGRAGDFAPDSFSPRVSGVHAVLSVNDEGRWTIEHTGRNETSVERAGTWTRLRTGCPVPLFGGETLKLADMLFRVTVEESRDSSTSARSASARDDIGGRAGASAQDDMGGRARVSAQDDTEGTATDVILSERSESKDLDATRWSVRCPVCGTEHVVASADERVAQCAFCQDPMDARQIARVAPRAVPAA